MVICNQEWFVLYSLCHPLAPAGPSKRILTFREPERVQCGSWKPTVPQDRFGQRHTYKTSSLNGPMDIVELQTSKKSQIADDLELQTLNWEMIDSQKGVWFLATYLPLLPDSFAKLPGWSWTPWQSHWSLPGLHRVLLRCNKDGFRDRFFPNIIFFPTFFRDYI